MKFYMALGVVVWVWIAVWLVRLALGLDHLSPDQIPIMLVSGTAGGLAGWYVVSRDAKRREAERKGS